MKISTLCFLKDNDELLLAMKKRGFGAGRWNGAGGKVLPGESIEKAALRELYEEVGVTGRIEDLKFAGLLRFRSDNSDYNWDVHVFFLLDWSGEPSESEEMRPQWHKIDLLPFDSMWPDDKFWLPEVIRGKKISGDFRFDAEGKQIVSYKITDLA